jgi:predicted nucleic acid-binding protein
MANYLLDTTTLVAFARRGPGVGERLSSLVASRNVVGVCPVTVAEFHAGLRPERRPEWGRFFVDLVLWSVDHEDGVRAGTFRYTWARRGRPLQTTDTLIAAVARRVGATVITENLKDFPMPEVRAVSLLSDEFAV